MSRILTIAILLLTLLGCDSEERSVSQWHLIKHDMTKAEVLSVIGDPDVKSEPAVPEVIPKGGQEPTLTEIAATGIGSAILGTPQEYWEYYPLGETGQHREPSQEDTIEAALGSMFGPADKSFVVYFNSRGAVTELRRPLTEFAPD